MKSRVQFERRELGVELVKDTDVMPVDPTACLPQNILKANPEVRHLSDHILDNTLFCTIFGSQCFSSPREIQKFRSIPFKASLTAGKFYA